MNQIVKVADTCFVNYSSFQDRVFYDKTENRETLCHDSSINISKIQHNGSKMVIKKIHLMGIYVEVQKHFQTLNSDLLSTTKENGM